MTRIMLPSGKALEIKTRGRVAVIGDQPEDPLFVPDVGAFAEDELTGFDEVRRLRAEHPELTWFVMVVQP